ncbi:MAG: gamma-glutamylcyclotransferase family protein [Mucilaginibacter sp.]
MNDKLFVYGTLLDEYNKYGIYLRDNSRFFATAKIHGKLYDIGEYPGAVLLTEGTDYIYGTILELDNPHEVLALVDMYEGFGDDQPQPNEFVRLLAQVETEAGTFDCWIYLYNLPVNGLIAIKDGRYFKQ